jgi:HEAT repeat protein/beta-lactamase regulating signal transducer with metallopeptidase domain
MTPNDLLPAFSTWASWLPVLDAVAKSTIILGLAGVATALLQRASAASRHLVWTAALLAALVLPALSLALPRWQMPIVTLTSPPPAAPVANTSDEAAGRMAASLQGRVVERSDEATPAPAMVPSASARKGPSAGTRTISWQAVVLFLWAAGAALVLGRLLLGFIAVQLIARRTEAVDHSSWLPLARDLAQHLGVSTVAFRRSGRAVMPMAFGVVRPTVVMPATADAWPPDRLRIVLLHELAHVKRRDCLTHMLAQLACALYWFNPLAWVAARRVRAERERACDDLVLAAGTPGADYADQLLEIARVMRAGRFPSVVAGASLAMAHRSQLEGRLMAILDPSVPRGGVSRMRTLAAAAVAAAALIPLASMQTWTYEAQAAMLSPAAEQQVAQVRQSPQVQPPAQKQGIQVAQSAAKEDAVQGAVQGATQGAMQGAIQGAMQGAIQGVTQGALQGVSQGAVQGATQGALRGTRQDVLVSVMPNAVGEALESALGEAQSKADPKLVAALTAALKDTDKEVREAAMHALVQMRDPTIFEPLVQALKDAAPDVRQQAAFGLGQMRDKRALEPLIGALKDSDAEVREQAAFALGQLRDRASVDALAAVLRDTNADVREQAIFALGQIRDPRAVEPLISALKDGSADAREQAAFALGQLRAPSAVEALVVALKDSDPDVREQAAFALGQIRDPRAIDGLTVALKDANASVRQQAAFALGQLAR